MLILLREARELLAFIFLSQDEEVKEKLDVIPQVIMQFCESLPMFQESWNQNCLPQESSMLPVTLPCCHWPVGRYREGRIFRRQTCGLKAEVKEIHTQSLCHFFITYLKILKLEQKRCLGFRKSRIVRFSNAMSLYLGMLTR